MHRRFSLLLARRDAMTVRPCHPPPSLSSYPSHNLSNIAYSTLAGLFLTSFQSVLRPSSSTIVYHDRHNYCHSPPTAPESRLPRSHHRSSGHLPLLNQPLFTFPFSIAVVAIGLYRPDDEDVTVFVGTAVAGSSSFVEFRWIIPTRYVRVSSRFNIRCFLLSPAK
ncbi:hypothetical protein EDD37DRAFT_308924 [Exophiala viscosa]|uniref:Uncharacterized protein n=1 Tax=Exophiala viscosa TaxID=2486360 RepID=A0AAN6IC76_9EURO|nr:hypothetical protein EDD36DRAFT_238556 [Exophiala viscosa]KAI1625558.1 hypothetical protein EDD37DRAFT_308924 [Exophiala viscosa]